MYTGKESGALWWLLQLEHGWLSNVHKSVDRLWAQICRDLELGDPSTHCGAGKDCRTNSAGQRKSLLQRARKRATLQQDFLSDVHQYYEQILDILHDLEI